MSESFLDGKVTLHAGDCLDVLSTLDPDSIDSCVTDPPYHLTSIVKRFGAEDAAPAKSGKTGAYKRASAGFMGKQWDGGEIAFEPETWAAVYRVLKPGGHLCAFGAPKNFGFMQYAISQGGFEIRDCLAWLFGSGFPKSHNQPGGWGTALKPAFEPIILARKPLIGTVAANITQHGTGALNIDGCRVATSEDLNGGTYASNTETNGISGSMAGPLRNAIGKEFTQPLGRWPANVIHDGSDEVVGAFPDVRDGGGKDSRGDTHLAFSMDSPRQASRSDVHEGYGNSVGSAARFFYQAKHDVRCELCSVNIAVNPSRIESTQIGDSVLSDAAGLPQPVSEDSAHQSCGLATDAANNSKPCHPQIDNSAPLSAANWPLSKIVQNVSDAASLCVLCATSIAHALAEVGRTGTPVPVHFNPSIGSSRETILSRCLASYVASRESTDTILTTTNLRELFGCVFHAIAGNTNSGRAGNEGNTKPASKRLFYSSKADADDRLGSKHPTVKPLDLMQWLVRLVTPKRVLFCPVCDTVRNAENSTEKAGPDTPVRVVSDGVQTEGQSAHGPVLQQAVRGRGQGTTAEAVRLVREDVSTEEGRRAPLLQSVVRGEVDRQESEDIARLRNQQGGIQAALDAGSPAVAQSEGLHLRAPLGDAADDRSAAPKNGSGASQERKQIRQPAGQSGTDAQGRSRQAESAPPEHPVLPSLSGQNRHEPSCPHCGHQLAWRPGVCLDPFAGTGTTGEAAFREGMRAILIEREAEYQDDIRRRMAHAMAGPEERKRTIAKTKHGSAPMTDGLFAAMGDQT